MWKCIGTYKISVNETECQILKFSSSICFSFTVHEFLGVWAFERYRVTHKILSKKCMHNASWFILEMLWNQDTFGCERCWMFNVQLGPGNFIIKCSILVPDSKFQISSEMKSKLWLRDSPFWVTHFYFVFEFECFHCFGL